MTVPSRDAHALAELRGRVVLVNFWTLTYVTREVPELFITEVRAAFRSLRSNGGPHE